MTEQQNKFIAEIAPIIGKYAAQYGYGVTSVTIAQACIESGFGNAWSRRNNNYFGIKYGTWVKRSAIASKITVVQARTNEEYRVGQLTSIIDGFCKCPNMDTGVALYYEFLRVNSRYRNLKECKTAAEFANTIKADGYATSSSYVQNLLNCVRACGLEKYDGKRVENTSGSSVRTLRRKDRGEDVKHMQEMLITCGYSCGPAGADGIFGTGTFVALCAFQKASGIAVDGIYGPKSAKALETAYAQCKTRKSVDTIAREVIAGKWGSGRDRIDRLEKAGYDATQIQHRVNELLRR
ncbi:MAG: peptidoglycan-binding protein [Firmicutes bacterium]|nr:peptidoglycan-binding protein [Bacillota bacterium]